MASTFLYAIFSTGILYKYFGPQLFGAWSTIFSLTLAFGFLNLGIGNVTLNEMADAYSKWRKSIATNLILAAMILSAVTMVIVFALGFLALGVVGIHAMFKGLSAANESAVRNMFVTFLVLFALSFPASVFTQALRGLQQAWITNICNCFGYFLAILGTLLGVRMGVGMSTMLAMTYGVQVAAQFFPPMLVLWFRLRGARGIRLSRLKLHTLHLTKAGASFFALQLCTTFAWLLDYVILSGLVGPVASAHFAIIQRLFQIIFAINGVTSQLWPIFAFLFSAHHFGRLRRLFFLSLGGSLAFAVPVSLIIWLLREPITHVWIGAQIGTLIEDLGVACGLYAIWACAQVAGNLLSTYLNAIGKVSQQVIPAFIFAGSAFALKIYWVRGHGIAGLIMGGICGYALGNAILFTFWGRDVLSLLRTRE
jgi:O-antigen/teichoic acid export membrane protein